MSIQAAHVHPSLREDAYSASPKVPTFKNPMFQQTVLRHFDRNCLPYLTRPQSHVFRHILDQTISAGRATWGFSYRKIAEGDGHTKGVGLSRRQVIRIVASLEKLGVISVDANTKWNNITPDIRWMPGPDMPTVQEKRKQARQRGPVCPNVTAIEQTLREAYAKDFSGAQAGAWTDTQRLEVAMCISVNWPKTKEKPERAIKFADWLVAVWPELARKYVAPDFPEVGFLRHHSRWLLAYFRLHMVTLANEPPAREEPIKIRKRQRPVWKTTPPS